MSADFFVFVAVFVIVFVTVSARASVGCLSVGWCAFAVLYLCRWASFTTVTESAPVSVGYICRLPESVGRFLQFLYCVVGCFLQRLVCQYPLRWLRCLVPYINCIRFVQCEIMQ